MHEETKAKIDLAEYLASFWNPKAVQAIKRDREKTDTIETDKEEFEAILRDRTFKDIGKEIVSGNKNKTNDRRKMDITKILEVNRKII